MKGIIVFIGAMVAVGIGAMFSVCDREEIVSGCLCVFEGRDINGNYEYGATYFSIVEMKNYGVSDCRNIMVALDNESDRACNGKCKYKWSCKKTLNRFAFVRYVVPLPELYHVFA